LRPVAGDVAEVVFALGILGTGLLAIPVLAGRFDGLRGRGRAEVAGRIVAQAASGCRLLCRDRDPRTDGYLTQSYPLDPIAALYWSAVANGALAAPVMVILMLLVREPNAMGKFVVRGSLYWLGWISTAAMALCVVGMGVSLIMGIS
jgi:Mn2+/Fe2+ NRAMP family transporter